MKNELEIKLFDLIDEYSLNLVLRTISDISKDNFDITKHDGFKIIAKQLDDILEQYPKNFSDIIGH